MLDELASFGKRTPRLRSALAAYRLADYVCIRRNCELERPVKISRASVFAVFVVTLTLLAVPLASAQTRIGDDFAPGLGFIYGQGATENGAPVTRYGLTSRRMQDGERIGSLGLLYQEIDGGLSFGKLHGGIRDEDVQLRYRSVYAELKRYFPIGGPLMLYWGLRGGYTRVDGRVRQPGRDDRFEENSAAPLWFLAVPFVLEHPGFLLVALVDGSSLGLTFDLFKDQIWVDLSLGSAVLPHVRSRDIDLDQPFVLTGVAQLVVVF
jgi:hypothetical protein